MELFLSKCTYFPWVWLKYQTQDLYLLLKLQLSRTVNMRRSRWDCRIWYGRGTLAPEFSFGKCYIRMRMRAFPTLLMQCAIAVLVIRPPLNLRVRHWQASLKNTPEHELCCYRRHFKPLAFLDLWFGFRCVCSDWRRRLLKLLHVSWKVYIGEELEMLIGTMEES